MSDLNFDIAVIGGGASGLCFAVRSKQLYPQYSVAVIEQLPRVGKKLITTGNGRCNITNKNIKNINYGPQLFLFHFLCIYTDVMEVVLLIHLISLRKNKPL